MIDFLLRMITPYRPHQVEPTEIAEQEVNVPARDAARLVRRGRAVNFAYGADGLMHLRRRARQVRREFGVGFRWFAMPKAQQKHYIVRRDRRPWWWF